MLDDRWWGALMLVGPLLLTACSSTVETSPATKTRPDSADVTSGASGEPMDASQSETPDAAACQASMIHVALGEPQGNSDFDFKSVCPGAGAGPVVPVANFAGGELMIAGCASADEGSPGLRLAVQGASGPDQYSTNAIEFVDPALRGWSYAGSAPSTKLGWTTTISSIGPVGGLVTGTYIGALTSGGDTAQLMGYFSVCRGPDLAAP